MKFVYSIKNYSPTLAMQRYSHIALGFLSPNSLVG